ncbi:hypothetical protein HP1_079 [Candidatus Termititenax spirochaetophilus]|uniref:Uncharacterized protein n=1 Tax=Candidatus Termititenax spirochaetophilus TaxID=2218522 RepID=A0A388T8A2_9BACT|nr:hypothetical protein HP1_079 [Candidatus Termititenax spirochaetophilus]
MIGFQKQKIAVVNVPKNPLRHHAEVGKIRRAKILPLK